MATVVRAVTCLVYSDNERNHTAPLSDPSLGRGGNWSRPIDRRPSAKTKEAMAMVGL